MTAPWAAPQMHACPGIVQNGKPRLLLPAAVVTFLLTVASVYKGYASLASRETSLQEDSDFTSIILSRLLAPPAIGYPDLDEEEAQRKAPYACLVLLVADGDTLHCARVTSDAAVLAYMHSELHRSLVPVSVALATPVEVYMNRTTRPQLVVSPWPARCGGLTSCAVKVRLYAIDTPEMSKGGTRPFPRERESPHGANAAAGLGPKDSLETSRRPFPPYGSAELDIGGQPLGVAAAASLADRVLGRVVLVQPLKKDIYGRTLARILVPTVQYKQLEGPALFSRYFQQLFSYIAAEAARLLVPGGDDLALELVERLREALRDADGPGGLPILAALPLARQVLRLILAQPFRNESPQARPAEGGPPQGRDEEPAVKALRRHPPGGDAAFLLKLLEERNPPLLYDASELLVQQGLCHLYKGGSYAGRRDRLRRQLLLAKENRKGLWGLPVEYQEDPAEYRRRKRRAGQKKDRLPIPPIPQSAPVEPLNDGT
ncbi:hypothetical protein ACSSS7_004299 [Eimeria intestinalis]